MQTREWTTKLKNSSNKKLVFITLFTVLCIVLYRAMLKITVNMNGWFAGVGFKSNPTAKWWTFIENWYSTNIYQKHPSFTSEIKLHWLNPFGCTQKTKNFSKKIKKFNSPQHFFLIINYLYKHIKSVPLPHLPFYITQITWTIYKLELHFNHLFPTSQSTTKA